MKLTNEIVKALQGAIENGYESVSDFARQANVSGNTITKYLCKETVSITDDTWRKIHPELAAAVFEGREGADTKVAAALFKRACGYELTEERIFQYQGDIVRAEVDTVVQPDVKAQQLWLLNRRRTQWAGEQKQEVQMDASVNINIQVVE